MSHGSASTNPHASSLARMQVPGPSFRSSSQCTASRTRQQHSGGTPVVCLVQKSNIHHSPIHDDQPEYTADHSLGSTGTQTSPCSTAFVRAGSQQHMQPHPGARSMRSQVGSAKQPCRLAHDGPVHEIMVLSDRVVTRGGRGHLVVMKEWTLKGELIGTQRTCKQGQHIDKVTLRALLSCLHPLQTGLRCSLQRCSKVLEKGSFRLLFGHELAAKV